MSLFSCLAPHSSWLQLSWPSPCLWTAASKTFITHYQGRPWSFNVCMLFIARELLEQLGAEITPEMMSRNGFISSLNIHYLCLMVVHSLQSMLQLTYVKDP